MTPKINLFALISVFVFSCTNTPHTPQRNVAQKSACGALAEKEVRLETFLDKIRDPNCNVKSLEDALHLLPPVPMAELVYRSRSLQGPHEVDYMHPRAILNFNNSLLLTFNGKNTDLGHNRLEIAEVNLASQNLADTFTMRELSFPQAAINDWQSAQSLIKLSAKNPQKCTICHGQPARPIYGAYPIWEGFYGSSVANEPQERKYLEQFLQQHRGSGSRYDHFLQEKPVANGLLRFLGGLNSKLISEKIKRTPDFNKYKYAIAAALINCPDSPSFLGRHLNSHIQHLDNQLKISQKWTDDGVNQIFRNFASGNDRFSNNLLVSRSEWVPVGYYTAPPVDDALVNLENNLRFLSGNSPFMRKLTADTFQKQKDFARMYYTPALLRLIFEGRGVKMHDWPMDLVQPTYRFSHNLDDIIKNLSQNPNDDLLNQVHQKFSETADNYGSGSVVFPEDPNLPLCKELKTASLAQMNSIPFRSTPFSYETIETQSRYPNVFLSVCTSCHMNQDPLAPYIPFESPESFKSWLVNKKNYKKLNFRIFSAPELDRMPPNRFLSPSEKSSIRSYLNRELGLTPKGH